MHAVGPILEPPVLYVLGSHENIAQHVKIDDVILLDVMLVSRVVGGGGRGLLGALHSLVLGVVGDLQGGGHLVLIRDGEVVLIRRTIGFVDSDGERAGEDLGHGAGPHLVHLF